MSSPAASRRCAPGAIEISRRSERDRPALEAMYAEVFGAGAAERNRARWQWQYEDNPHVSPEGPEIWVARENGSILGQYATMPVRVLVKGKTLRGSWGMDVMVQPGLQRKGIGSRLFLYWDKQVEASLGLGLSPQSYALFRKLQWEDVGPVPCFSKVVDPTAISKRRLPGIAGALLAPIVRFALWLFFPWRRSRSEGVAVAPLEGGFGAEYDELWKRAAPGFDFVAERKQDYLEWKFRRPPHVRYDMFEARRRDGRKLTGYVVLRTTMRSGVKLALLVDLLAHPEDEETLGALLDRAVAYALEEKAARIQSFTFDARIARVLKSKGFFPIPSPMQFCLRIHGEHVDPDFFRDTSRWHVSFGDSDQDRDP